MSKYYSYMTLYRPPMPGGIPREGLSDVKCFDQRTALYGTACWGVATYTRPLTEKEIRDYELKPLELGYERETP